MNKEEMIKRELAEAAALLKDTKVKDDIRILVKLISQMLDECDGTSGITAEIPVATEHCKYWPEFRAGVLIDAIEAKYKDAPEMEIPAENLTSY